MKALFFAIAGLLAVCTPAIASQCHVKSVDTPNGWVTMSPECRNSTRQQIQMEVGASLQYLALGAHFSRDVINRPGFAKFFFDAASEEREHAMLLIDYMLMRGELTADVSDLIKVKPTTTGEPATGAAALEFALKLEANVTESIRTVINACENAKGFNDYHFVDYLSGDFLDEQYKGQRDLAGKISTLKKMVNQNPALGEFIFDKKLLGMDI